MLQHLLRPPVAADRDAALDALRACGAFSDDEVRVAIEMFDDGLAGDYTLVGVEAGGVLRAYACIGKAWLTEGSWYLYWICVHPGFHGSGMAQLLQQAAEAKMHEQGGQRLVLETSGRAEYERSRRFYRRQGFVERGRIVDFYKPGDDCLIYCKTLGAPASA